MFAKLLKEKHITQKKLSVSLNISQSAVSQWNSNCLPKLELVPEIAKILNCSIEQVVLALINTKGEKTE